MKKMRTLAAVMAAACAISSLGISASAADVVTAASSVTAAGSANLSADAAFTPVTIKVGLPATFKAAINPYKVAVTIDTGVLSGNYGMASPAYQIVNDSVANVGIIVSAKTKITPGTGIEVADKSFDPKKVTEKQVFAFLNTTDKKGAYASTAYNAKSANQIAFGTELTETAKEILTIGPKSNGYYEVMGDSTAKPEVAWTNKDKVKLDVTFDLAPYIAEDNALVITKYDAKAGATAADAATAVPDTAKTIFEADLAAAATDSYIALELKDTASTTATIQNITCDGVAVETTMPTIASGKVKFDKTTVPELEFTANKAATHVIEVTVADTVNDVEVTSTYTFVFNHAAS